MNFEIIQWGVPIVMLLLCVGFWMAGYSAGLKESKTESTAKLIGWRTEDYLMETCDRNQAKNWEVHHKMLPIFEGDLNTKLTTHQAAPKGATND